MTIVPLYNLYNSLAQEDGFENRLSTTICSEINSRIKLKYHPDIILRIRILNAYMARYLIAHGITDHQVSDVVQCPRCNRIDYACDCPYSPNIVSAVFLPLYEINHHHLMYEVMFDALNQLSYKYDPLLAYDKNKDWVYSMVSFVIFTYYDNIPMKLRLLSIYNGDHIRGRLSEDTVNKIMYFIIFRYKFHIGWRVFVYIVDKIIGLECLHKEYDGRGIVDLLLERYDKAVEGREYTDEEFDAEYREEEGVELKPNEEEAMEYVRMLHFIRSKGIEVHGDEGLMDRLESVDELSDLMTSFAL